MKQALANGLCIFALIALAASSSTVARANTRTLETRFALSSDLRSEFSTRFTLPGAGLVSIEASWKPLSIAGEAGTLTMLLMRPDGAIAMRKSGGSVLDLEYLAGEDELRGSIRR